MLSLEKFENEHDNKIEATDALISPGISSIQWPPYEDVKFDLINLNNSF